jgi:hypothetical protein
MAASAARSMTCRRLYPRNTLLKRLPQDLEAMAAALGPCIQAEHAVVRPRHLARHRHVAPRRSGPHLKRYSEGRDTAGSRPLYLPPGMFCHIAGVLGLSMV